MDTGVLSALIEAFGIPVSFALMVFVVWYYTRRDSQERDRRADKLLSEQVKLASRQTDILEALKNAVTSNNAQLSDGITAIKNEIKNATSTITGKMDEQHTVVLSHFTGILDRVTALQQMFTDIKTTWQSEYQKTALAMQAFEFSSRALQNEILSSIRTYMKEESKNEKIPNVSPNHQRYIDE